MILYPEIAIRDGQCVSHPRAPGKPEVYGDATEIACEFVEQGAEWLHLVDLDAEDDGAEENLALISNIAAAVPIPVEVSGGVHSLADVEAWMAAGVDSVVIGDEAYRYPSLVESASKRFPYRILISVSTDGNALAGHTSASGRPIDPIAYARRFDRMALSGIVVEETADTTMSPSAKLAAAEVIAAHVRTPVIGSDIIRTTGQVGGMAARRKLAGAIVGAPLYDGVFSLREALKELWGVDPAEAWWRNVPAPKSGDSASSGT
ncbi:HisA/HisF-related TIM barrel protein [Tranquillimonas rosea]|uniref:HisA/HisF-related TIM barrel protein n=1 Tax=Tranquillimonas rosea TaxID=641238 RepID=UPI003BAC65D2